MHDHVAQRYAGHAPRNDARGRIMSVMSQLSLLRSDTRCGCCGRTEEESRIPTATVVIDWHAELMCDACVARHDWSDWTFDPILNLYVHV